MDFEIVVRRWFRPLIYRANQTIPPCQKCYYAIWIFSSAFFPLCHSRENDSVSRGVNVVDIGSMYLQWEGSLLCLQKASTKVSLYSAGRLTLAGTCSYM